MYGTTNSEDNQSIVKVGFPAYWGSLIPSLQHTAYADAILSNQYESLVKMGHDGTIVPSIAKSWSISTDFRIFTFKIDTSKKFSDGSQLQASHIKKAWEHGMKLAPKSSNSSLVDVLYKVEGYKKDSDKVDGLVALDDETFQIRFKLPFRMALEYLTGTRVSIFLKKGDTYLGTGSYIIKNLLNKRISLRINPFSTNKPSIKQIDIEHCAPEKASNMLKTGELDIFYFAQLANIEECHDDDSIIGCFSGQETHHVTLAVNSKKGSFFENDNHRKSLSYLIHKNLKSKILPQYHRLNNMKIDPQVYLPFQSGRILEDQVKDILNLGKAGVNEMIEASQRKPIRIITSEADNWVQTLLEKEGVRFSENSGWMSTPDRVKVYYKTNSADLVVGLLGVGIGDPDGLYHALGENGAILSPMIFRKKVGDLLEEGRAIIKQDLLHNHYKKVSKAILEEVPFVHLGFAYGNIAYRKDRVSIKLKMKNRNEDGLNLFSYK